MKYAALLMILTSLWPASGRAGAGLRVPPELIGAVATPNDAFDVVLSGSYALVADYAAGLHIVDISDATLPVIVATRNTPGFATHIALAGNIAYVADHAVGGVRVINVSNKVSPVFVASYVTGETVVMVAVRSGLLAVGYLENTVELVDVVDPSSPVWLGAYATDGPVRDAVFDGGRLLVADSGYGLLILDVGSPATPASVGRVAGNRPVGIGRVGDVGYLADLDGLKSYDIGDRSAPTALGSVALPGPGVRVRFANGYAIMADHVAGGLQIVDVSTPSNPVVSTGYVTDNYAHGVAVAGEHAYLVDGEGLKVFRVFDTTVPVRSTTIGGVKALYRGKLED